MLSFFPGKSAGSVSYLHGSQPNWYFVQLDLSLLRGLSLPRNKQCNGLPELVLVLWTKVG